MVTRGKRKIEQEGGFSLARFAGNGIRTEIGVTVINNPTINLGLSLVAMMAFGKK